MKKPIFSIQVATLKSFTSLKSCCAIAVASCVLVTGCCTDRTRTTELYGEAWHKPITSPNDLKLALETRWPLEMIRAYCSMVKPAPPYAQNLVADGDQRWEGQLYVGTNTSFDSIWWYAGVSGNSVKNYSLNATKGSNHWIIETCNDLTSFSHPVHLSVPISP